MKNTNLHHLIHNHIQLKNFLFKLNLSGLMISIFFMFFFDAPISQFFTKPENLSLKKFFNLITDIGLAGHYFVIVAIIFIISKFINKNWIAIRHWSINAFYALILSGIIIHIIKFFVGRMRPYMNNASDVFVFSPFNTNADFSSFASGHTQVMFTVATIMSLSYPKLKWFWYLSAAIIGFSRVGDLKHYTSDVIFGACVGITGTLLAYHWLHNKSSFRFIKKQESLNQ